MKRILVVSQHFWPEPFRINDIVEGFVEDGLEVDVLCGYWSNDPTQDVLPASTDTASIVYIIFFI